MTNEQINIAIAKACGWNPPPEGMGNMTHGGSKFMSSEEWRKAHIPNYCNDLNAMHEAEKILTGKQRIIYADQLCIIWTGRDDRAIPIWFWITEATARQRAEAFLKTLGKWEGAK